MKISACRLLKDPVTQGISTVPVVVHSISRNSLTRVPSDSFVFRSFQGALAVTVPASNISVLRSTSNDGYCYIMCQNVEKLAVNFKRGTEVVFAFIIDPLTDFGSSTFTYFGVDIEDDRDIFTEMLISPVFSSPSASITYIF